MKYSPKKDIADIKESEKNVPKKGIEKKEMI
jgi:hypothetical protein